MPCGADLKNPPLQPVWSSVNTTAATKRIFAEAQVWRPQGRGDRVLSENSRFRLELTRDPTIYKRFIPRRSRISGQIAAQLRPCSGEPSSVFSHLLGRLDQPQPAERDRISPRGGRRSSGSNWARSPGSTMTQRRRLAAKAKKIGFKRLQGIATLATPRTLLDWQQRLIARKYDSLGKRSPGRPPTRPSCAL